MRRKDGICPTCEEKPRKGKDAYCADCRRAVTREWMRLNRTSYAQLSEEARVKIRCRAYTNVLIKRGKLKRGPCAGCGTTKGVRAHHRDYTDPRNVTWLCTDCPPL